MQIFDLWDRGVGTVKKCNRHNFKNNENFFMLKMKQQNDINVRRTQKKFESHMGFEPTTLCDLVVCSNQ